MSRRCQSCGVVGLSENDVHLAQEILGEGWETMCIECARSIQRHNETHHQCNYCEEEIQGENVVPRDNSEWELESKKHRKDCEWVLTRAHTRKHKMKFFVKDLSGRGFNATLNEKEVLVFKDEVEEKWKDEEGNLEQTFEDWLESSEIGESIEFDNIEIVRTK